MEERESLGNNQKLEECIWSQNSTKTEKSGTRAPDEIIQEYDGRCPSCNKRLSYIPKNVEVKPFDVPNRWNPFEPQKGRIIKN